MFIYVYGVLYVHPGTKNKFVFGVGLILQYSPTTVRLQQSHVN